MLTIFSILYKNLNFTQYISSLTNQSKLEILIIDLIFEIKIDYIIGIYSKGEIF